MSFPLQAIKDLLNSNSIYEIEGVGHVVAIGPNSATVATGQGVRVLATANIVNIGDTVAVSGGNASKLPPIGMAIEV